MNYADDQKRGNSGIGSALGAAVVGAAVGAAAAYLSDSQKRKNLTDKAGEVKKSAVEVVNKVAKKTDTLLKDAQIKAEEKKDELADDFDTFKSNKNNLGTI